MGPVRAGKGHRVNAPENKNRPERSGLSSGL